MPHSNGISELLGDISKLPEIELPLNCAFGPEQLISSILYPEQRTKGVAGNGCTPHESESSITKKWTEKLTELRKFLYPSDPDTKNSTEEIIPAHELLHMVIGMTSNECHQSSSTRILIMILACHAVRVSVDVDPKRWKRIQSMTLECIAHFQRNFLDSSSGDIHTCTHDTIQSSNELFCMHIIPSLTYAINAMEKLLTSHQDSTRSSFVGKKLPDKNLLDLAVAGLISTATTLSQYIVKSKAQGLQDQIRLTHVKEVVQSLGKIPTFRQDELWIHPIRENAYSKHLYHIKSNISTSTADDQSVHEGEDSSVSDSNENSISLNGLTKFICSGNLDEEIDEIKHDRLCGMETKWDNDGLALMASCAFFADVEEKDDIVFWGMYSTKYTFEMFFPHITRLLDMSQRVPNGQDSNEEIFSEESILYMSLSMALLSYLLERVDHHLISTIQTHLYRHKVDTDSGPLSPVGMIQLLLNYAVNISSLPPSKVIGSFQCPGRQSLPQNPSEVIGLIRRVLEMFETSSQIKYIGILVKQCPFPFLVPLLLDSLRPALLSADNKEAALSEALCILQSFLGDMLSCLVHDADDSSLSNPVIGNVDKVMENVEVYNSVISLLRLYQENISCITDVLESMRTFYKALLSLLSRWENYENCKKCNGEVICEPPPDDFFRLNLLDITLESVLGLYPN